MISLILNWGDKMPKHQEGPEKLLMRNCIIREKAGLWHENGALAIKDGYIEACGSRKEVLSRYGDYPDINLKGKTVLAGFNDAHLHLYQLGKDLSRPDLSQIEDLNHLKEKLLSWLEHNDPAPEELIRGARLDDSRLPEGRLPDRMQLDRIIENRPLLLERICYHAAAVNTKALKIAGIDRNTPDPPGGRIGRDKEGSPDGRLFDSAVDLVKKNFPSPSISRRKKYYRRAGRKALSCGVTSLTTDDLAAEAGPAKTLRACRKYSSESRAAPRLFIQQRVKEKEDINWLQENSRPTGQGDLSLRFGPIKIMLDGTLGAETAALSIPYRNSENRGDLLMNKEKLKNILHTAEKGGFSADIHVIGDRAIDTVISSYKDLKGTNREISPPRMVHCQIPRQSQLDYLGERGFRAIIQPVFVASDWKPARKKLPRDLLSLSHGWNSMLKAGMKLAAGSDAPIESIDPLPGIDCAVNRQDEQGKPEQGFLPGEKISLEQALMLYTRAGAAFSGEDDFKGTLSSGKLADLAVINASPRRIKKDEIRELSVIKTFLAGMEVYSGR